MLTFLGKNIAWGLDAEIGTSKDNAKKEFPASLKEEFFATGYKDSGDLIYLPCRQPSSDMD